MNVNKIKQNVSTHVRRLYNSKSVYDFPPTRGGWEKRGLAELPGSSEEVNFDPYVNINGEMIELYYSNRTNNCIMMTKSRDTLKWGKSVVLLNGQQNSVWETAVNRPCVIEKNGIWFMWYTGQNAGVSNIGLAMSRDGVHYNRYEGNPLLKPEMPFEKNSVMNPCVLWNEDKGCFYMYYAAGETYEPDVICLAQSHDGMNWKKYEGNPILEPSDNEYDKYKVGACDVHQISKNSFIMFYIGYQNLDNARICVAESVDGMTKWKRLNCNPILSPSPNEWDAHAIYKPAACLIDDSWYLWYNGRRGRIERIGSAVHSGKEL